MIIIFTGSTIQAGKPGRTRKGAHVAANLPDPGTGDLEGENNETETSVRKRSVF
jgi:hypothetical protein